MRMKAELILFLLTSVVLIFCSCVYGEPADHPKISFSVPYNCETAKGDRTRCLTDGFKPGLNVVLLNQTELCNARTADVFTDKDFYDEDFAATRLLGNGSCFKVKENESWYTGFDIAVVGADPSTIKLVPLKDDRSPVPKHIEAKARKLVISEVETPQDVSDPDTIPVTVSKSQPIVHRAAHVTLLTFELLADGSPWQHGPTVALINGKIFLLDGLCTNIQPIFFSVNDKLYLTYMYGGCDTGDRRFYVYDFSSGIPKMVYVNGTFAT